MAVDYFRTFGGAYDLETEQRAMYVTQLSPLYPAFSDGVSSNNATISSLMTRGFTVGEEYYGTFSRALFTLFQASRSAHTPLTHPFTAESVMARDVHGRTLGASAKLARL